MKIRYFAVLLPTVLALIGCGKSPVISGSSEAKSQNYYASHIDEAKLTAEKCIAFESAGYSTLSPSEQASWNGTTDGINCNNARLVMQHWIRAEHNRKMREADERILKQLGG